MPKKFVPEDKMVLEEPVIRRKEPEVEPEAIVEVEPETIVEVEPEVEAEPETIVENEPEVEIDEEKKDVTAFNFGENRIRAVVVDDGTVWFVAKDIAESLGYRDSSELVRILDEDEKGVSKVHTLGGEQKFSIITESGVYHAAFASRKPTAQKFRRWVTEEVLPTIRKTGKYEAPPPQQEQPASSDMLKIKNDFAIGIEMANMIGLDGNRAILKANNLVREVTSVDVLKKMDVRLIAEVQDNRLTPTQIRLNLGKCSS